MKGRMILGVMLSILLFIVSARAGVPPLMSYQGKLTDENGNPVSPGDYCMEFKIYDSETDGIVWWSETQDPVPVAEGLFSVLLGEDEPIPDTVFHGADRWLGVALCGEDEMIPRQRIASTGYTFMANALDHDAYTLDDLTVKGLLKVTGEADERGPAIWIDGTNDEIRTTGKTLCLGHESAASFGDVTVGIGTQSPDTCCRLEVGSGQNEPCVRIAWRSGKTLLGIGVGAAGTSDTLIYGAKVLASGSLFGSPDVYGGYFYSVMGQATNRYGVFASVTGDSEDSNYGVYATASNATTANYGVYASVPTGQPGYAGYFDGDKNYFSGNVGIGAASPENKLHVTGAINLDPIAEPAVPSTGFVLYVDSADGRLKAKASTGTITVLANP